MEVGGVGGIMGSTYVIVLILRRRWSLYLIDRTVQEMGGACVILGGIRCIVGGSTCIVVVGVIVLLLLLLGRGRGLYMIGGRAWVTSVVCRRQVTWQRLEQLWRRAVTHIGQVGIL